MPNQCFLLPTVIQIVFAYFLVKLFSRVSQTIQKTLFLVFLSLLRCADPNVVVHHALVIYQMIIPQKCLSVKVQLFFLGGRHMSELFSKKSEIPIVTTLRCVLRQAKRSAFCVGSRIIAGKLTHTMEA